MGFGVKLHVWGDRACFTRPEMKVERVSYDVITPSAARGIIEAIHWKPAITWVIDRIHVLKPIRFESLRRNEVGDKIPARNISSARNKGDLSELNYTVEDGRQQRATTLLRDVAYVIEAHFNLTPKAGKDDSVGKHLDTFNRRARRGQCFHAPCLGVREFPAAFELLETNSAVPVSCDALKGERDLGFMLHDIDFANGNTPCYYRAHMVDGIIAVPPFEQARQ
ncbi:type I-C CRISPR-associated protein Cas5c [Salinisphaera sp. T31B1]|uniref:type I-C CRISPR-associated protein Cas5c n=1 Tax=Salinisphaera sp. T31B1 TaxID=727963 RepID=UPI0033422979